MGVGLWPFAEFNKYGASLFMHFGLHCTTAYLKTRNLSFPEAQQRDSKNGEGVRREREGREQKGREYGEREGTRGERQREREK